MKKVKKNTNAWINFELKTDQALLAKTPDELLWNPLKEKMSSLSYMTETNGGGQIELIPGINRRRALTAGLGFGQLINETPLLNKSEMVAQAAVEQHQNMPVPVPDTSNIPWRSICQLIITLRNGKREIGTAWFAGPALLVTAGHCIFDHVNGGQASSITVIAANGTYPPPLNMWQASGAQAHPNWVSNANPGFDYGFITLADPLKGQQLGWFGFSVLPDDKVKNLLVNIAGYPANQPNGMMWCNSGRINDADDFFLDYMLGTEAGESGGPVFWFGNNQRIVVAIHAYHAGYTNKGLRITQEMYDRILEIRGF